MSVHCKRKKKKKRENQTEVERDQDQRVRTKKRSQRDRMNASVNTNKCRGGKRSIVFEPKGQFIQVCNMEITLQHLY